MLLTTGAGPAARASPGAAFWILLFGAALAILDAMQALPAGSLSRLGIAAFICAMAVAMANAGIFNSLSIAREYPEQARHLRRGDRTSLRAGVGLASAGSLHRRTAWRPCGRQSAAPRPVIRGAQYPADHPVHRSLRDPDRAAVGSRRCDTGVAPHRHRRYRFSPALIALVLYALLPIVRNTYAGLVGVDPAVIEAAKGMGLTRRQIFRKVEVPLALPVLLAGLRIVTVQAIGLAVVAALVGAGGLGTFVFQGLGQNAADLVLLGAIPAILLALAADFLLQAATDVIRRRAAPC